MKVALSGVRLYRILWLLVRSSDVIRRTAIQNTERVNRGTTDELFMERESPKPHRDFLHRYNMYSMEHRYLYCNHPAHRSRS